MTLRLVREPSLQGTTFGVVFLNDRFECFSLEDEIREIPGAHPRVWKVPGETAIPAGRYRLTVTPSPRFKRPLPEVLNVPGFTGIRIHPGNSKADSEGCILLGAGREGVELRHSRVACDRVLAAIESAEAAGEPVWLRVENPMGH